MAPRLRLFCFSYAGGSAAAYAQWQALLGPQVEVCALQLPGRGARMGEAPMTALPAVVAAIADVIARQGPLPYACFGHSLGALLAFEKGRYSKRQPMKQPAQL
jgi:medium-chain acyl-[acyl-carrier-protein] hydrolase